MLAKIMKKSALATTCALAVLTASSLSAHAANTVEVQVKGTLKPPSCTPLLGGGAVGVFDHGNIDPSKVTGTNFYVDPTIRELSLTITCDGLVAASITTESQRKNTVGGSSGAENSYGVASSPVSLLAGTALSGVMGLGTVVGKPTSKIGGYSLAAKLGASTYTTTEGGLPIKATSIYRNTKGTGTWTNKDGLQLMNSGSPQLEISWAAGTGTTPVPFLVLNTVIQEQAYLNKSGSGGDLLDKSGQVDLDGDAIITVNYL